MDLVNLLLCSVLASLPYSQRHWDVKSSLINFEFFNLLWSLRSSLKSVIRDAFWNCCYPDGNSSRSCGAKSVHDGMAAFSSIVNVWSGTTFDTFSVISVFIASWRHIDFLRGDIVHSNCCTWPRSALSLQFQFCEFWSWRVLGWTFIIMTI